MSEPFIPEEFRRFPQRWEVVPFIKAFSDETGGNPKIKKGDYLDAGCLPVIDQGHEDVAGYIDDPDLRCRASLPCLLFGDHTKVFKYVDQPFALGADGVKVLRPSTDLDTRFAYHYLRQVRLPENAGYSRHFKFLKRAYVPLPPLPEQRRIAAILDKADTIRGKRQEAIRLMEEFLHSVFSDMFGNIGSFKHVKIQDIASKRKYALSSGPFGSNLTSAHYTDEGVIVLRGLNISEGRLNLDDVKFVSEEKAQSLVRSEIGPGDIVVVAVGSSGLACQIPNSLPRAIMSQNFNKISPDVNMTNPTYLEYCINSLFVQRQLKQEITDTVRTFLSLTKLKNVEIPLPPLRDQEKFAQVVRKSEQLRTKQRRAERKSDDIFNSLVHRAFRGELKSTEAELVKNRENRNAKWGWTKAIV